MLFYAVLLNFAFYLTSCELQGSKANNGLTKKRWVRSVINEPTPIDCVMSSWSSWSGCDPCKKKRYRFTQMTHVPQFRGERCDVIDREEESCATSSPCRNTKRCEGFQCVESGKCVPRRLMCNGDDDCGDSSDEKNCKSIRSPCTDKMEEYWAIENLASGLNLFTNLREGLVFDHRYYGGGCAPHYILGTRFRKPFNVESYITDAKGEYKFSLSEHDSYSDFERDFSSAHAKQTSFKFGFSIPEVFEIGFSYSDMKFKKFVERTKKFSHTQSSLISARSDLEVAKYKLKSRGLMLHSEFFQRVKQLPMEYVYGEYRDLFRDYGTHYITEATLGGVYEYTLILNKEHVKNEGYSLSDVKSCLNLGFSLGGNVCGVYISGSMTFDQCDGLLKEIGEKTDNNKVVEDFVALVRGGSSEHVTTLAYRNLPTPELMQEWGDAVQYSPEILKIKASPLYELVTATDFIGGNTLQENMKRALEEFEKETMSCRCAPCENNGVAVFKENRCECVCPAGFKGSACEISKRPAPPIDGNWSCWTSWTSCSGRVQTRQRQCNNPSPRNGGQDCPGASTDSRSC
ncbi:PREDICTED: complement component C8 beta chain [Nanorana parkeri]|uniref:complement component C8 beta chain n=1 Tax=Nanorana parkeri TaxID=125878 RepID=UPI00085455A3|nr:PREDICTED: complement component C8 beta chain [Nanorana parkeri]